MTAAVQVLKRNSGLAGWVAFVTQVLIAISVEVADDLGRALFSQHGTLEGIENARHVASFEAEHGFFVEPAWQSFFEQTHHLFLISITWAESARVMNGIYVLGHVFVTLSVACWLFFLHRPIFALFRNTVILVNVFALLIYESYPVAPPRLSGSFVYDHHRFFFQDTLFGIVSATGKTVGTQSGFNEFSAMPSVHMAWALIVSVALIALARPIVVKAFGALYPIAMLVAIVVTGNHYILDAVVGGVVVILGFSLAGWFEWWRFTRSRRRLYRQPAGPSAP